MVTQRTQGLYRVFLLCQIAIVAALFWFGVWVMVTFYSPGAQLTWRRYSIYCAMLVLGMIGESLSREGSKNYFLQAELLRQHRLSFRQTVASVGKDKINASPTDTAILFNGLFMTFSFSVIYSWKSSLVPARNLRQSSAVVYATLPTWPPEH